MDGNNLNQGGFEQPVYEQQPVYNQGFTQAGYDPNQGAYQQPADLQGFNRVPTKCPGKEIAGLVLGINSLVWGILGLLFSWIPIYGMIFSFIWGGLMGVGCGIATNILHKKVHEEAEEITGKIETAKKLAVPGIILGIVGCVISIIVLIVFVIILGAGAVGALSNYRP